MAVLIDLGDPRGLDEEPAAGPLVSRAARRGAALVAVVLAGLLGLGGSAAVPPPPLVLVAHFDPPVTGPVVLSGDLALALERQDGGRALLAIGGGAVRWRLPLEGLSTEVFSAVRAGPTLLVTLIDSAAPAEMWTTYAVEPDTGTPLWQARAMLLGVAPRAAEWTAVLGGGGEREWLGGRDVAGGRELWRRALSAAQGWTPYRVGPDLAGLVLFETAGAPRARLLTPDGVLGEPRPLPTGTEGMQVAADLVVAAYERDGARRIAALRLPALEPVWDVAHPVGGYPYYVEDCAPMVCVTDSDRVWVLDPADGAARWQGQVGGSYALAPGVLVSNVNERPRFGVLRDTVSGRVLLRLADWSVIEHDGRSVLLAYVGDDRTWFGAAEPAGSGRLRVLGVGGPTLDRCWADTRGTADAGLVVCQALLGGLDVYRYTR
ncbi:hypothetical protein CS0771_25440 [Catellatospora sp. IY07-71]|uniref:outer membrane protein assembly factor BamB family protein n=1 Tax=Catellatospora sp. IY07-71 TaxID=2728827 RepID=UPI001BB32E9F|nr:hypothetical protein [Catellatospora sp. IY07-71]BCJ73000.1 hypothetical protein CS0771_25440 [Catellatospora sp. IY07-71]